MHLPKISHLNAIYFKLFVIWFALVHVALRFMLWFCWYLNWKKKHRKVHGFCLFCVKCVFSPLPERSECARILCMRPWDSVHWTKTKTKRTIFVDLFFFRLQSKQCGNGKTNVIANLHRQWCSHSVPALSHQLPAPFCKLSTHHQMRLLLIDGFFPFQFNQMSNDTLCRQFACYLLRSLCYWFSKLFFYYLLSLEKFYDFQGNSKYQANQLVANQPASQRAHITMNFRSIYRQSEYMPSRAVWYNNNSNSKCSTRSIYTNRRHSVALWFCWHIFNISKNYYRGQQKCQTDHHANLMIVELTFLSA